MHRSIIPSLTNKKYGEAYNEYKRTSGTAIARNARAGEAPPVEGRVAPRRRVRGAPYGFFFA